MRWPVGSARAPGPLFIYRKIGSVILSHTSFRVVPKSVILKVIESRNIRDFALSQLNSVVVKVRLILSAIKILYDLWSHSQRILRKSALKSEKFADSTCAALHCHLSNS